MSSLEDSVNHLKLNKAQLEQDQFVEEHVASAGVSTLCTLQGEATGASPLFKVDIHACLKPGARLTAEAKLHNRRMFDQEEGSKSCAGSQRLDEGLAETQAQIQRE